MTREIMGFLFKVFSYFENGITDTTPKKILDLPSLTGLIKNHPQAELIKNIRTLRANGDESYKALKTKLPNATLNCIVTKRKLDNEEQFIDNFVQFSGYIYFDLDKVSDVNGYKHYFIEKYSHIVSLVCLSSSLGGLSVLVKVSNHITKDNFELLRTSVIQTYFMEESKYIDKHCVNIGRAWFISSDPDAYVNYDNEVKLNYNKTDISTTNKRVKQPIYLQKKTINRLFYSFSELPTLEEIMSKIKLKIDIPVYVVKLK